MILIKIQFDTDMELLLALIWTNGPDLDLNRLILIRTNGPNSKTLIWTNGPDLDPNNLTLIRTNGPDLDPN